MIKKFIASVLLVSLSICQLNGVIYKIDDLSKFEKEIRNLPNDTLVLLDVDETIITPKDTALKYSFSELFRKYLPDFTSKKKNYLKSIMILGAEFELVDQKFPSIIKNMQKKGIKVMAFTALETGSMGKIRSIEDWRIAHLKTFGIDFSSAFLNRSWHVINDVKCKNTEYPLYKEGILFSNGEAKGEVLYYFLRHESWKPKKIILVDDWLAQLKSVETACASMEIDFIGFHYLAAKNRVKPYDEELFDLQFKHLVTNEEWLTDSQAKALLVNK